MVPNVYLITDSIGLNHNTTHFFEFERRVELK